MLAARSVLAAFVSALGLAALGTSAGATTLTFDAGFANGSAPDQAYGDRVSAASQGGFSYGTTGGFTPDVVVSYGGSARFWASGYGDLTNVLFAEGGLMEITLTADPGHAVALLSFDLAGWPQTDRVIESVSVVDGDDSVLFFESNVLVEGDANGPGHTSFDFDSSVMASELRIRFDASNLGSPGSGNISIDNVSFAMAPEPSSVMLLCAGLVGLAARRRSR